ncbi:MAG: phosphatase PAP2 family protein [Fimbriimonadales bacterium]|nr:phosphatase PAP2 family protein [Fimbriimonadales bacterium]
MAELDRQLFYAINGWPEAFAPLFWFFSEATKQTWVRVALLGLALAMVARGPRTRWAVLWCLLAVGVANELCDVLKNLFMMPRPSVELSDAVVRTARLTSFGTASAHSANMAAVAWVMVARLGRWGWVWVPIALLTGLSRIYNGVHYPYQVLLGGVVGLAAGFALERIGRWIERGIQEKRQRCSPPAP